MSQEGSGYGAAAERTELRNMAERNQKPRGCCLRHPIVCGTSLVVIAVVSVVVAAALGAAYYPIRHKVHSYIATEASKKVKLTPGSIVTDNWSSSKVPLYAKYYFFNIKNPDDVQKHGAKPELEEVGPFTYRENRTKFNITWNHNQTVVSYKLNVTYTLDEELSVGDPKTTSITTINLPLVGILMTIERMETNPDSSWIEKELAKFLAEAIDYIKSKFSWESLFRKLTVEELLWGYEDELLKYLHDLKPDLVPTDVFSLEKKSEIEAPNSVYTGVGNSSSVGQYIEWNGNTEIWEWKTPTARMINGTGGFMFHPGISRHENLTAFISELFRSGYFSYSKDVTVHGIKTYQFVLPYDELLNSTQDPGFSPLGPSGVLNLTAVFQNNVSIFASKPHFLDADPGFLMNVTGLSTDRSLHDSHLDVEPLTGAVMSAAKRIQINLQLKRYPTLAEVEHVPPEVMLPVFWASEEGTITSHLADEFKKEVYGPEEAIVATLFGVIALAVLVLVVSLLCLAGLVIQQRKARKTNIRSINNDEFAPLLTAGTTGGSTNI